MDTAIGIDVGGTHIRTALVNRDGSVRGRRKMTVGPLRSADEIVQLISSEVRALEQESSTHAVAIGVGLPGIVSSESGIVYSSPHYPLWENVDFKEKLVAQLHRPLVIDNDANLIAIGEQWQGAARDWPTFLMVTLGTGIGGAIVHNSKIFHGTRGFAGEFGHMVIESEGPPCACGSRGCLETFVSASALSRLMNSVVGEGNLADTQAVELPRLLVQKALEGSEAARQVLKQMGYYLGVGLASLVNVTGIERIVIGGGLVFAADHFLPAAQEELKKRTYGETSAGVEIRLSQLGDDGGVVGAASSAFASVASKEL